MKRSQIILVSLVVGVPCLYMFCWLFPVVYSTQVFVNMLFYPQTKETIPIILMSAFGVLTVGLYGILGVGSTLIALCEIYNSIKDYIKEWRNTL